MTDIKSKVLKAIRAAALILVLIFFYKIYLCFGVLSYQATLNYGSSVKGPVSLFILFEIILYLICIVVGIVLFFHKSWSYRPALLMSYFLLITSSLSFILFFQRFSMDLFERYTGYFISIILPLAGSLVSIYFLRRPEVRSHFMQCKTESSCISDAPQNIPNAHSGGCFVKDSPHEMNEEKDSIEVLHKPAIKRKRLVFVLGTLSFLLMFVVVMHLFRTFQRLEKTAEHVNYSQAAINDPSKDLYKLGCARAVKNIVFSPDGRYLYAFDNHSFDYHSKLIMWDVDTGEEVKKIDGIVLGHPYLSPNGKFILSKVGAELVIWEIRTEKEISRIALDMPRIFPRFAFSADGQNIIIADKNDRIYVNDVSTGRRVKELTGAKGWVDSLSSSFDGKYIVAARKWRSDKAIEQGLPHERSIVAWNYQSGKIIWERNLEEDRLVCFSPDGRVISVWDYKSAAILLLDATNGKELKSLNGSKEIRSVSFSPDGKYLLSGGTDAIIRLWDVASGKEIKQLVGHSSGVSTALFSPDGKNIISSSKDETIRLWSTASGKEIRKFERNCRAFYSVAFAPSGNHIISVSNDNSLRLWDVQSGQEIKSFNSSDKIFTATFSPDGKYVVSSAVNNMLIMFDALSGKKIKTFSGHTDFVSSAVFTPDGKSIISGSNDKTIRIWDVSSGKELQKFTVQNTGIKNICVSPNGQYIVSCGFDNGERRTHMKLWNISTGKEILEYTGYSAESSAIFSPDSKFVLSWGGRAAAAWLINKEVYNRNFVHTDTINSVRFSPDGKKIVMGSSDGTIRLCDFASQKELSVLKGHTAAVTSVAFSPDGKQIISGSMDNTLRLWDVASGKELGQFEIKQN